MSPNSQRTANSQRIGVLALQGSYEPHRQRLNALGATTLLVRKPEELQALDGLVLPGGESTAMLKLMSPEFRDTLSTAIENGLPTFATCAGVILLAKKVSNPTQDSLGVLDITITRNGYGRQADSFVNQDLTLSNGSTQTLEGIFIRAPIIESIGPNVQVLIEHQSNPVLIKQNNILAATFHPELSESSTTVHELFLDICQ